MRQCLSRKKFFCFGLLTQPSKWSSAIKKKQKSFFNLAFLVIFAFFHMTSIVVAEGNLSLSCWLYGTFNLSFFHTLTTKHNKTISLFLVTPHLSPIHNISLVHPPYISSFEMTQRGHILLIIPTSDELDWRSLDLLSLAAPVPNWITLIIHNLCTKTLH